MTVMVACHNDKDFAQTQARQKQKRIFTSDMLNGLTDLSENDPNTMSSIIAAAGRKDINAIVKIGMSKLNIFGK